MYTILSNVVSVAIKQYRYTMMMLSQRTSIDWLDKRIHCVQIDSFYCIRAASLNVLLFSISFFLSHPIKKNCANLCCDAQNETNSAAWLSKCRINRNGGNNTQCNGGGDDDDRAARSAEIPGGWPKQLHRPQQQCGRNGLEYGVGRLVAAHHHLLDRLHHVLSFTDRWLLLDQTD